MLFLNLICFFNLFGKKKEEINSEPISLVEITQELGISPVLSEKYHRNINSQANTFSCFDGLKVINLSLFNNNYCDCQDCSDEPGSPASATLKSMTTETKDENGNDLLSYFYCQNPGYVPELIPRWGVGDGICSCCDGADEAFNPHAKCINKCKKLEKKRGKLAGEVDKAYRKGNEKYKALIKEGYERQENAEKVYTKYHSQIERLEKAKSDIDNAKEIPTPTPSPDPEEHIDEEMETNYNYYDDEHHRNEEEQVYAEKVDDGQIDDNVVQTEIPSESQEESSEAPHSEADSHNEEEVEKNNEGEANNEAEQIEPEVDYENNGTNCSQTIDKEFFYSYHFPFCIDDSENPYPNGLTYDQKNDRRNTLYHKIDDLKNQMNSEESAVKYYNKNIPPEFLTLGGKEFSKGDFKITFLEEIKESYSSLGTFKEFKDGEFFFEDGAYCWETGCGKKTAMRLICWEDNALISVTEATRCEYKAVFATPLVCTDDYVEKAANMTVRQLKKVRKEAGV